ncbi:MAG: hypothetical protein WC890_01465, partial [Candidatus Margulisiibacteriota bacterium]
PVVLEYFGTHYQKYILTKSSGLPVDHLPELSIRENCLGIEREEGKGGQGRARKDYEGFRGGTNGK